MVQQLNQKFVIIAGVPKSGSASLYQYINSHPQIAGESRQESRYFLYPPIGRNQKHLPEWISQYLDRQLEDYFKLFSSTQYKDVYHLSVSGGFWATSETAKIIHQNLPNAKLIFIFRDPVERFISWFRFQKQLHHIPLDATLEQFMQGLHGHDLAEVYGFSSGKYAERLRPYWEVFEHDNILLLSFSDLKNNPLQLMQQVCKFLDIDAQMYDDYEFVKHNVTQLPNNVAIDQIQNRMIMPIRRKLLEYPKLFNAVSAVNHRTWLPLYQRLNGKSFDKSSISTDVMDTLRDYYKDEARLLFELTGIDGLLD